MCLCPNMVYRESGVVGGGLRGAGGMEGGKVDPKKVGSSATRGETYQTAFLVTQTDIFAAGVARTTDQHDVGVSVSIYWNTGQTNTWIFHESQGRMDRPFWQEASTRTSRTRQFPDRQAQDAAPRDLRRQRDHAVDWNQGVELYNAARLAGV